MPTRCRCRRSTPRPTESRHGCWPWPPSRSPARAEAEVGRHGDRQQDADDDDDQELDRVKPCSLRAFMRFWSAEGIVSLLPYEVVLRPRQGFMPRVPVRVNASPAASLTVGDPVPADSARERSSPPLKLPRAAADSPTVDGTAAPPHSPAPLPMADVRRPPTSDRRAARAHGRARRVRPPPDGRNAPGDARARASSSASTASRR